MVGTFSAGSRVFPGGAPICEPACCSENLR
jgi:hypothetical protein